MSPVADGRKKEGSRLDGLGLFLCNKNFIIVFFANKNFIIIFVLSNERRCI